MNLDPLSLALSQIGCLVSALTRKNYKQSVAELSQLVETLGIEANRYLLQCLFAAVDFSAAAAVPSGGSAAADSGATSSHSSPKGSANQQAPLSVHSQALLHHLSGTCFNSASCLSAVCYVIDQPITSNNSLKVDSTFFAKLRSTLRLSTLQETVIALSLQHSSNSELVQLAGANLRGELVPRLIRSYVHDDETNDIGGGLRDATPEVLHLVLSAISAAPKDFSLTADEYNAFLSSLQRDFPPDRVPVVLGPLVYPDRAEVINVLEEMMASSTSSTTATATATTSSTNIATGTITTSATSLSSATVDGISTAGASSGATSTERSTAGGGGGSTMPGSLSALDGSLVDIVSEVGYAFTASLDECHSHLQKLLSTSNNISFAEAEVARLLAFLCRTSTANNISPRAQDDQKKPSNWNVDVFVQAVHEVVPIFQWTTVVSELDHSEFIVKDRAGLALLFGALKQGLRLQQHASGASAFQSGDLFPVEQLYRRWSNPESQLSLLQALLRNVDVFCFADYACLTVSVDSLKSPPEQDSKELANWRCLPLLEVLLAIAELPRFYAMVHDIFKFPIQHCPDVLVLGLLQCQQHGGGMSPPSLKNELLSTLVPIFLGNHPNSGIILHTAWHTPTTANIKQIIMLSMAEWYIRGSDSSTDQTRLSRILDVAQDLKALSMLLNVQSYQFIIDLACLASRREYLKLEKWLTDKIREHGEQFVAACVKFIHRRGPHGISKNDDALVKSHVLPTDTITTLVGCLQAWSYEQATAVATSTGAPGASNFSLELQQAIHMLSAYAPLLKSRQQQQAAQQQVQQQQAVVTVQQQQQNVANILRPGQFNASSLSGGQQLYPNVMDPSTNIASLSSALTSLSLSSVGGSNVGGPPPGSAFSLQGGLGPLVPTQQQPGSPSRLMAAVAAAVASGVSQQPASGVPTTNPYAIALQQQQQAAAAQAATSQVVAAAAAAAAASQQTQQTLQQQLTLAHQQQQQQQSASIAHLGASAAAVAAANAAGDLTKTRQQESMFPDIAPNVSKDIEDEANGYFQRIYNNPPNPTLTIDEVLEMLKRFQDSPVKREREVFNCMLRNLFEEYRFFPQYPDKELHITAQLFGGIIERGLVTSYMALGLALRFVLDALRKQEGTKMYYFGIAALDRFKSRLKDYHKYCEHVRAIPHFKEFPQHLIEYVEYGLKSAEPPNKPTGQVLPASIASLLGPNSGFKSTPPVPVTTVKTTAPVTVAQTTATTVVSSHGSRPSIANATNIDTLLVATEQEEKITSPPEMMQDKTAFIFNNLSQLNLQTKCDELKELVSEEYWPWLSQYLVLKRASIEFNFHALYSNFLDVLRLPDLNRMVTKETFRNIKVLLRSDKGIGNFSDRSLLKNLGHWLGMMTLGRNKPILQVDIDLKSLLVEAYHKGQQELLYVVPFVAKIVESCAKSKVFKPPNPWTLGIMNVLGELHQEPELKLNLKFEIEVLCKNLELEVGNLKSVIYLKDSERFRKIEFQLSQPQKKESSHSGSAVTSASGIATSSGGGVSSAVEPELAASVAISAANAGGSAGSSGGTPSDPQTSSVTPTNTAIAPEPRFAYNDIQLANNAALHTHLTISPSILLFQTQPNLKPLVRQAIERAIHEWIAPVVDRSIKIALQTCEQIIRKDFALDPDLERQRTAAHYMVRNLAAGMSMITCREQLLTSINNQMKQALQSHMVIGAGGSTQQHKEMIEQAAQILAQDNMELACAIIQKTTIEKAIPDIDKRLQSEYDSRKLARQEGRRYCDAMALTYQAERMPEKIRLKVGGVTASQMAVYEEFGRNIPGFQPMLHAGAIQHDTSSTIVAGSGSLGAVQFASPTPTSGNVAANLFAVQQSQQQAGPPPQLVDPASVGVLPGSTPFQPVSAAGGGMSVAAHVTAAATTLVAAGISISVDECSALFEKLALDFDLIISAMVAQTNYTVITGAMHALRETIYAAVPSRDPLAAAELIVIKCVDCLQEQPPMLGDATDPTSVRSKEFIVRILKSLQDGRAFGPLWTNKHVTRALTDFRDDSRYNELAVETLIRAGLVNMSLLDAALFQAIELGNPRALTLATNLVQSLVMDERAAPHLIAETTSELKTTFDLLMNIHTQHPQAAMRAAAAAAAAAAATGGPLGGTHVSQQQQQQQQQETAPHVGGTSLHQSAAASGGPLSNVADLFRTQNDAPTPFFPDRSSTAPTVHIHNGILQVRAPNYEDPPGLVEKTDFLIREWINIFNMHPTGRDSTKAFSLFVHQMNVHGILKTDDLITRFFRLATQLIVEAVYCLIHDQSLAVGTAQTVAKVKAFNTLDAFVRLVSLLVKHSGETNNTTTKIHLLNKVLGIVAGCVLQDHDTRGVEFRQFPYHRIFIMLFIELNASEPVLEQINFHVLTAYCHTLHILRPTKAAGFCYAWLELVSHRLFLGRMLAHTPGQKGWAMYAQLLIDLFKYLAPFLRNAELAKPVTMLYKGTLRVLLVLLHDFPEFLCDYHYGFCDVIPPNCIQMRNLILSAFPRNMRLPDPFTPNLKVDVLHEIAFGPRVLSNYEGMITPAHFKKDLDSYLKARAPVTFLSELRSNLQVSNEPGMRYNIQLMNALVLYVGAQAINHIRNKNQAPNMSTIAHSAHMDIFQNLAVDLDTEGRYLFLNSIANQLRYPNSHTHYFSCTLLYLFAEANTEAIQEQITRVLLERLIVNRPHPWGLLITFIELIKNPAYKFWTHEFVHCASEIEKLFESVARSCFVQKNAVAQQSENDLQE